MYIYLISNYLIDLSYQNLSVTYLVLLVSKLFLNISFDNSAELHKIILRVLFTILLVRHKSVQSLH